MAIVNDREILLKEYREAYQNSMRTFQEQFGENAEKFAEQLNLRKQVFNQLIDRYLLLTDANRTQPVGNRFRTSGLHPPTGVFSKKRPI